MLQSNNMVAKWIRKQRSSHMLPTRGLLQMERQTQNESEEMEKDVL